MLSDFVFDKINIHQGEMAYNTFNIDLSKDPSSQIHELRQDLIQVVYGTRYVVDVGWYPMYKPEGFFLIYVVEDRDWDEPLLKLKVTKFDTFIQSLKEAIDFVDKFIQENPDRPLRESAFD